MRNTTAMPWRLMTRADLPAVNAIGDAIHLECPEGNTIVKERLQLYPRGCFVYEEMGFIKGYLLSHPWVKGAAPELNTRLGALPDRPDTYYLHDLVLHSAVRRKGAASWILAHVADMAKESGFDSLSGISINGSRAYLERRGFTVEDEPALLPVLSTYHPDAHYMVRRLPG